jgi:hypothetical protein
MIQSIAQEMIFLMKASQKDYANQMAVQMPHTLNLLGEILLFM